MTAALAGPFPGVVVADVTVSDVADGTNRSARVRLRYRDGYGRGPEAVFVKREGRPLHRLALLALRAVDTEARLFDAGAPLPLDHPAAYFAAVDRRRLAAVVVMEDVTLRSGRPNNAAVPLTVGQVADGLRGLANLHAAYWDRPLPPDLAFLLPWQLGKVWAPVSLTSLWLAGSRLRATGRGHLLPDDVRPAILEQQFRHWAAVAASGPQTVLHGDPHPGNTYALPGDRTGFYDWQLARTGNWSHDVGYFVGSSLTVADRRDHERQLLRAYLDHLADAGAPAPDFDHAWDRYRQTPAFGLASWLHTVAGGRFQPLDVSLAIIERFAAAYADREAGR